MALQKNKIYRAELTGYTAEGAAVARIDGMAVFVPGGAVGDQCDIKIVKVGKNLAFGRIERILVRSKHRIDPACPHAGKCGGCCYQHITYEEELRAKERKVADALRRIGGIEGILTGITGAEDTTHYRNKAQYPVGADENGPYTGFYRPRSHDIVKADRCLITSETADQIAALVCAWMKDNGIPAYHETTHKGLIRHIYVRTGAATGEAHLCLITARAKLPAADDLIARLTAAVPGLTGIVQNVNKRTDNVILGDHTVTLWGQPELQDVLCGHVFRLSPHAFYQVNHAQTERLYACALDFAGLTGQETVIDLYCGAGTITLTLADKAARVIGVEIVPEAIDNARENAARNHVENVEFICADAGQAAMMLAARGERPDVLTVDPPRKGLSLDAVEAIVQMEPPRVVYVSCDPATLARDCKLFAERGYRIVQAHAFDLFPRTHHVETVCQLERVE
ncbi:MAG: 23S rRNA (uracil(1939)-C(5))-methyltransferase RlmD [Butyricicoccus sp.]